MAPYIFCLAVLWQFANKPHAVTVFPLVSLTFKRFTLHKWCWCMNLVKLPLPNEDISFSLIYTGLSLRPCSILQSSANSWRKKEIAPIYQCHSPQTSTLKIDASGQSELVPLRSMGELCGLAFFDMF